MSLTQITAYKCQSCDEVSETYTDEPVYECSNCGSNFSRSNSADGDSHKCPNCNKFSAKLGDMCCDSCQEGAVEEIEGYQCPECHNIYEEDHETCPNCDTKAKEETELKRLNELPVSERGGQKVFSTKENAEKAFRAFLNFTKSPIVSLEETEYGIGKDSGIGIQWIESPKPMILFHFRVKYNIVDKYLNPQYGIHIPLSDLFYEEVHESAIKHLTKPPQWNNTGAIGTVILDGS